MVFVKFQNVLYNTYNIHIQTENLQQQEYIGQTLFLYFI